MLLKESSEKKIQTENFSSDQYLAAESKVTLWQKCEGELSILSHCEHNSLYINLVDLFVIDHNNFFIFQLLSIAYISYNDELFNFNITSLYSKSLAKDKRCKLAKARFNASHFPSFLAMLQVLRNVK